MRALFLLLCFTACASSPEIAVFEGVAMTIPYRILVGEKVNGEEKKAIEKAIEETFHAIDRSVNHWNPHSEISFLNTLPAHQKVPLSPFLTTFLERVDTLVRETDFLFDPSIAPLFSLWKGALEHERVPSKEEVEEKIETLGWSKIHRENSIFWKENGEVACDFSGIAKGHAVDLLVHALKGQGYAHFLVEWGGEMRAAGRHPRGRPWLVAIAPVSFGTQWKILPLEEKAIATSGDTFQHWESGGKGFSHLIHPKLLAPLEITPHSIASVTVMAEECLVADALATALMLFPTKEEGENFALSLKKNHPTIKYWIQSRES